MTYSELLNQKEWWRKCNEILCRDRYTCKDCGSLGFHNRGNYIKLDSLKEAGAILKHWFLEGKSFSEFFNSVPTSLGYKANGIVFKEECVDDDVTVYLLSLLDVHCKLFPYMFQTSDLEHDTPSPFDHPTRIIMPTNRKISINEATLYYIKDVSYRETFFNGQGWAYLFEFEETVSDNVYVNIEHSKTCGIEDGLHVEYIINISYGNRLLSLRFSTLNHLNLRPLNIHHTYYVKGAKPWEYENDSLVTLCEDCHKKRHETTRIPLYDQEKRLISNLVPCSRCGGSGYLPQYSHVEHGICFKCYGEGTVIE